MFISAIVVAAGLSKRFKAKTSKVLLKLNSKPVIAYSLDILNEHPKIKEIIIVANPQNIEELRGMIKKIAFGDNFRRFSQWYGKVFYTFLYHKKNKFCKAVKLVLGGKERKDSVAAGLKVINPQANFVLIHDAARPFITRGLVSLVINEAYESKAAILGVPVKATIKRCRAQGTGHRAQETIDRKNLWEAQTPQVFEKKLILEAYRRFGKQDVTDDAGLVEKLGRQVKIVQGSPLNIKITTAEDLILAEAIARSKSF